MHFSTIPSAERVELVLKHKYTIQEEPVGPRRNQEEPRGPRRSQEDRGGARRIHGGKLDV